MLSSETYLGDGVYAAYDGFHIWLDCRAQPRLSNGPSGAAGIALEPDVIERLVEFHKECIQGRVTPCS